MIEGRVEGRVGPPLKSIKICVFLTEIIDFLVSEASILEFRSRTLHLRSPEVASGSLKVTFGGVFHLRRGAVRSRGHHFWVPDDHLTPCNCLGSR